MENLLEILNPAFVAAILALTEALKRFLPSKLNARVITGVSTLLVGASAFLGFDYTLVESLINSISGILSAAGLYSLLIRPFKKAD